jgi:hypothetical protein
VWRGRRVKTPTLGEWIKALDEGPYEQGKGYLRHEETGSGKVKYCCLGALLDLSGAEWGESTACTFDKTFAATLPDCPEQLILPTDMPERTVERVLRDAGVSVADGHGLCAELAHANDDFADFPAIAAALKEVAANPLHDPVETVRGVFRKLFPQDDE